MILGSQVEWALHCMVVLGSWTKDSRATSKALAEFHGVPKDYLLKALQALSSAGLVESALGPKGGYRLAKPAEQISFLEIVEAVEGRKSTFNCQEIRQNGPCKGHKADYSPVCEIAQIMYTADRAWREVLRQKKLSEVIGQVERHVSAKARDKYTGWFRAQA
jgi:Rrf2 family protein